MVCNKNASTSTSTTPSPHWPLWRTHTPTQYTNARAFAQFLFISLFVFLFLHKTQFFIYKTFYSLAFVVRRKILLFYENKNVDGELAPDVQVHTLCNPNEHHSDSLDFCKLLLLFIAKLITNLFVCLFVCVGV